MDLRRFSLALLASLAAVPAAQAARFTYHGELMDGDAPAQGRYDLEVRAYPTPAGAKALGEAMVLPAVDVKDGRFAVELDLPEDADGMTWVEVAVRASDSKESFTALGERQPISKANSTCPGAWALDGNTGLPAGSFLGIADPAATSALELRAGNRPVARFTPFLGTHAGDAPAVALGSSSNIVSNLGATVAGGGSTMVAFVACPGCRNQSAGIFASVGGGQSNSANGAFATVAGGRSNLASAPNTTVSGGNVNRAEGNFSTIAGGENNNVAAAANYGAIGGGVNNTAVGGHAVVSGGGDNTAIAGYSNVAGGRDNDAEAPDSAIGGGQLNLAIAFNATVPGGYANVAGGAGSLAAGSNARVRVAGSPPVVPHDKLGPADYTGGASGDDGTFVWSDQSSNTVFRSTDANQFLVRAQGGVGINTATFGNAVDLRLSELVIRNPDPGGNVDLTLITQTNRGYGLAVVPGAAGAAGEFFISETDARTPTVGFSSRLRIDAAGTTFVQGGAVGNLSDARLKKNVAPIARPLETLLALQGKTFEYIDPAKSMNAPGPRMGFVAQDVQKVIADWVKPSGAEGYLAVTPIGFEALAVEAIRDLKAESDVRIEASATRIETLETENAALRARFETENQTLRAKLATVLQRLEQLEARRER